LHTDKRHHSAGATGLDGARDPLWPDTCVDLVDDLDLDIHIIAQHTIVDALARDAVDGGQRIGGNVRSHPLDDIAVVIVVGGLDQKQSKDTLALLGRFASGFPISAHPAMPRCLLALSPFRHSRRNPIGPTSA
jgi:hypothetical protein